jgi:hypothetical protein
MSALPLFQSVVPLERQHPIYRRLLENAYEAERLVLLNWSDGFVDRDGKFCHEFQISFESCFWELYIHTCLKKLGANLDFSHHAPDFVVTGRNRLCIEATIAAPSKGEQGPVGFSMRDLPEDFNSFNRKSTIRICNSFTSKVKKLRESYSNLAHCKEQPFVIAIAPFDRPFSHFSGMRPIISALYGLYYDEEQTLETSAKNIVTYNVESVSKTEKVNLPLGFFCTPEYADVSAVIYSEVATWGKIRAMADNPNALTVYKTLHPNPNGIMPTVKVRRKQEYQEDLLDGFCVFHNPFAKHKLSPDFFNHNRLAQAYIRPDGELHFDHPKDFLLCRMLQTVTLRKSDDPKDIRVFQRGTHLF